MVYDIKGNMINATKMQYVSTQGTIFLKEDCINSYPGYIWHSQAKFIDEDNIVYVSQMPYFGSAAVDKYVWRYNLKTKVEEIVWGIKGNDIKIGQTNKDKGIEIVCDNVKKYVNSQDIVE